MKTIKLFLCLFVAFIGMNANAQSLDSQKQELRKQVDNSNLQKPYKDAANKAIDGMREFNIRDYVAREASSSQRENAQNTNNNGGYSSPKNSGGSSSKSYSGGGSSKSYSGGSSSTAKSDSNSSPKNNGGWSPSPAPKSNDKQCNTPQCEAAKAIDKR